MNNPLNSTNKNYSGNLLLVIFGLLLQSQFLFAQKNPETLKRKASMGIGTEAYSDSLVQGIRVNIVRNGTAKNLGIEINDILISINAKRLSQPKDLSEFMKSKFQGEPVSIKIWRSGKTKEITGKFAGKDYESIPQSEVIYSQVPFRNGSLRCIISKPKGKGPYPALFFIPGYTCSSIDNLSPDHPYKRIIDTFANAGYATYRIEKSGIGDSWNTPECSDCSLKDEIENFEVGLSNLLTLPFVDSSKVFIFGHSMGGVIAPALTAKRKLAGVMVYGTTAKSWFEYILEMTRLQNHLSGLSVIEHEKSVRDQYELCYRFYVKGEKVDDIAKNPKMDSLLRATWDYSGNNKIYGRNADYWSQIQQEPILENWANTESPTLVFFGESDFQAFSLTDHQQIVDCLNERMPGRGTLIKLPFTDHYFARSGTMQQAWDKFSKGQIQQLFNEYNHEIGARAVNWCNQKLTK